MALGPAWILIVAFAAELLFQFGFSRLEHTSQRTTDLPTDPSDVLVPAVHVRNHSNTRDSYDRVYVPTIRFCSRTLPEYSVRKYSRVGVPDTDTLSAYTQK